MVDIKINEEKFDNQITFRLPSSLKLKLPGAFKDSLDCIKFKDGRAIGGLYRDLTYEFLNGKLEKDNIELRENRELIIQQAESCAILKSAYQETDEDNRILKDGATALLILMRLLKPSASIMKKVDMAAIKELKEVL